MKKEIEEFVKGIEDPRSLMIKVDKGDNSMEVTRTKVDPNQDIYLRSRLDSIHRSEIINKYELKPYSDSNDDRAYNSAVMNIKNANSRHIMEMARLELVNINTQFYYSTLDIALNIVEKELGYRIYPCFEDMLKGNACSTNYSPLSHLVYECDEVDNILKMIYSDYSDGNAKSIYAKDFAEFAKNKINMYSEKVAASMYNHIVKVLYTYSTLTDKPDVIQRAASTACTELHDAYMPSVLELLARFIYSYNILSIADKDYSDEPRYIPYGGF